ncbi:MAG: type I-U CRISPR-associated RAMP protein Csb1/Cas7u [Chloroflexota bacterium]|nr:type I-U CRISPR-associated RAMP protein Csb1/Cas7u [Chloroflexota bacterium]
MADVDHSVKRVLIACDVKPLQGSRFQPAGFPDLGAASYQRPDGTTSLLVDSPQAVANHLEDLCLLPDRTDFVKPLQGLSIVHVKSPKGKYLTNSVLEGHRLASPYILGDKGKRTDVGKVFDKIDVPKGPMPDDADVYNTVFKYDINSLLHGMWLSRIGEGRIKIRRAVSAFIEADNASEAVSGGVKRDIVTTSISKPKKSTTGDVDDNEEKTADASTGHGSIPFHRVEYAAAGITAYFNVDLEQIRSYGLGADQTKLLETLALWKIRKFVETPYRPRTACDLAFDLKTLRVTPGDFKLPGIDKLERDITAGIASCRSQMSTSEVTHPVS